MNKSIILGIMVYDRIKEAGRTQEILTRYASIIKNRLGFHELSEDVCSRVGTIILTIRSDKQTTHQLLADLKNVGGIEVKTMQFEHG